MKWNCPGPTLSLKSFQLRLISGTALAIAVLLITNIAPAQSAAHYVVTDDDEGGVNTATVFRAGAGPDLTVEKSFLTGGIGVNNGDSATRRVLFVNEGKTPCAYFTDAGSNDIAAFLVEPQTRNLLKKIGNFTGSKNDVAGYAIGLAANHKYLYASFFGSATLATFEIDAGCKLTFVKDIRAKGLNGGSIDGMAVHDNIMVVAYADGSIQSFNLAAGPPVSNRDRQISAGYEVCQQDAMPAGVDISRDGHYAIFADAGAFVDAEVSDISSGKLKPTTNYGCPNYGLGPGYFTANIEISPDESLIYISALSQSIGFGQVSAIFFDKNTGILNYGCVGQFRDNEVVTVSGLAVENTTGDGDVVYVGLEGNGSFVPTYIGIMQIRSSGGQCTFTESGDSPVKDWRTWNLRSIAAYPPRNF